MAPTPAPTIPTDWRGLVDDAAVFPPGDADLADAFGAYADRSGEWWAGLVGSFVVPDTALGSVPADVPVSVVLTSGAGAVEGVAGLAARKGLRLAGLEVAVRDADDPVGNVRRIDAAVRAADLRVPVHIEVPGPATPAWLAAADEVAACDHRLKLRLGHVDHDLVPDAATVATWIDAALDRECRFKATAGLHRAVRHDPEGGGAHGFLNVLAATQSLWDGGSVADATTVLEERDGAALARTDVAGARRWFTSFGSCSVTEPLDDLLALGLLEKP
ncbi:hypothetical protein NYO98_01310 [Nocardioides sp. STR2]|uniref:Uncharacterized protein n=1 Tax=Nocardioides pini TaxID=2975053 RepID=A0ABT4C7F9_9ACTN|nr:hypothetical protein [Nocardioides pini]MCY4724900.1 hypothetical protein [Nocardioides pini]